MSTNALQNLSSKDRVTVMMAVLLDGHEAEVFLGADQADAKLLKAALELLKMPLELRAPLLGTLLRREIATLDKKPKGSR